MVMATGDGKLPFECFLHCCFILLLLLEFSGGQSDVLAQGQELTAGSRLVSATGIFSLGFFSPSLLNNSYIAIWYHRDSQQPVWIANRNSPFPRQAGLPTLTIDRNGTLKIVRKRGGGGDGHGFSFSLFEAQKATNSNAILLDSGNFVLRELNPDGSEKRQLWQSFDHPTDTLLPGMKIGIDHKTGSTWSLTSRRGDYSVLSGSFTFAMNPNNTNQLLILLRGAIFWTSGNWQDGRFELSEDLSSTQDFKFQRFSNENETFFNYSTSNIYRSSYNRSLAFRPRFTLGNNGNLEGQNWGLKIQCPFFENELSNGTSPDGCVGKQLQKIPTCRNPPIHFSSTQRFGNMEGNSSVFAETEKLTIYECEKACISSCDCIAYSSTNEEGTGCEMWSTGAKFISVDGGKRIIWSPETQAAGKVGSEKKRVWLRVLVITLAVSVTLLLLCFIFYFKCRTKILKAIGKIRKKDSNHEEFLHEMGAVSESFNILSKRDRRKSSELQFFSFETIVSATNNFDEECRLGEGGFGPVYKGTFANGREVAIKRLSRNSGQGLEEFKNEVILIAKLQHTNLVKLIGCCIYKEEKMLVYEYMPNRSLDSFLFDPEKKLVLDWDKRFHIIEGIIQGLLYLHSYSRVRIIHRDLKASNILLDDKMNANISDFGMARIFDPTKHQVNTSHIVGTHGYMSPEYAMEGIFSIKSDVYSFGVLLLEIVTGRKNYDNYNNIEQPINLIGHAWELWVNGRGEELIDPTFYSSDQKPKALRCVHISLLCVQQMPAERPTMFDVSFMVHNDSAQLPPPKQPPFFISRNSKPSELEMAGPGLGSESESATYSLNSMSVSVMFAR